jgi:hypothetical protein
MTPLKSTPIWDDRGKGRVAEIAKIAVIAKAVIAKIGN